MSDLLWASPFTREAGSGQLRNMSLCCRVSSGQAVQGVSSNSMLFAIQPPNFLLQPRSSPIHSHHRRRTPGDSHHRKTPGDSIHRRRGSHYRRRDNHHRRRDSRHRRRDSHHHRLRLMTEKLTVISSLLSTLSFTSLTRSTHLDVPKMKKGV